MRTIGKYILIKVILEEETKTSSGIMLSAEDTKEFRYQKGKVIVAGTDVSTIQEGDIVYFDKIHSFTMLIKDEQVTIISEKDVVVVE